MSSAKQIEANRKNAQKSKGPRTAEGKGRASRNSRKHALNTISHNNPLFAQRIEAIAREICPERANSALWEQALIIGECTTVLVCVQATRIALIEQSLGSASAHKADADGAGRAELGRPQCEPAAPRDELEAMGLAARELDRLQRYERRALSRRKQAIETFIAISYTPGAGFCELPSAAVTPGVDAGCIDNQISIFGRTNPNSPRRREFGCAPHASNRAFFALVFAPKNPDRTAPPRLPLRTCTMRRCGDAHQTGARRGHDQPCAPCRHCQPTEICRSGREFGDFMRARRPSPGLFFGVSFLDASLNPSHRQHDLAGGRPRGSGLNSCSPVHTTTNVSRRRRRALGFPPRRRSSAAREG
jgi:hypothetical protein